MTMRHSSWLRAMAVLCMLQACSDHGPFMVETEADAESVLASSAGLAPAFDPLVCSLRRECTRWGELIDEPPAVASECAPLAGHVHAPAWLDSQRQVACPFGRCRTFDTQLLTEPDGQLLALSKVELPSTRARGREAGLWLARLRADGSSARGVLTDFAVPPPGIEVQRHASLLRAANGDAMLASARAILPGDALRPLSVAAVKGRQQPALAGPSVTTPPSRATLVAVGPRGELLVASAHRLSAEPSAPANGPSNGLFAPAYPQRAALTLHDRHGRVLWNRPWPADASTQIEAVHMGTDGAITVQVSADGGLLHGSTVARLDRAGRVLWQRLVGGPDFEAQSAVDQHGHVYVLSSGWRDEFEARLDRLEPSGHRALAWNVAAFGDMTDLHAGVGRTWLTVRTDVGFGAEVWALPFEPTTTSCVGQRHAWPDASSDFLNGSIDLHESDRGRVYVANNGLIAELAGGAP